ncbi:AAA domain-containing protein [Nocardia camponoti]|uniref:AAA+ ATPase domain-containing protein n=1 Tax=Nocardia camponoti TaxID=1616106 RepID=A0A917VDT1_9NOCA|nr:AAA domain-containing protein [Nocardia camponoti]GGK66770.1 hypothetical protein GCM10011591_43650 [Nocardia camponoti]
MTTTHTGPELAELGGRLFDFLAQAQQLRVRTVSDLAQYERDGAVLWMANLPDDASVAYEAAEPGTPFLVVQKTQVPRAPMPSGDVDDWLEFANLADPNAQPRLRAERIGDNGETLQLADHPEIEVAFKEWLTRWQEWGVVARPKIAAVALYQQLYEVYTNYEAARETFEVVFGIGLLSWHDRYSGSVRRHVLTVPVSLRFDTGFGALSVALDENFTGFSAELEDFVEPRRIAAPADLRRAENEARTDSTDPFEREDVANLVRGFINCINSDAEYRDELEPGTKADHPLARYAPAVILRKRSQRGMVNALRTVATNLRAAGDMPDGMINLVDTSHQTASLERESDGAIVVDGADKFLPLPLNSRQLQILDHVDNNAHTLVQGPPGTGKTHTAAALIAHLLAQGKRVLVTAHTDRALQEVRERLPEEIKPLCVTVIGDSQAEREQLQLSVRRLNHEAGEHDPNRARATEEAANARIEALRRARRERYSELLRLRERDVTVFERGDYRGSLASIATQWCARRDQFDWATALLAPIADQLAPTNSAQLREWLELLRDSSLTDPEAAAPELVGSGDLPLVDEFAHWVDAEHRAAEQLRRYEAFRDTAAFAHISATAPQIRQRVVADVRSLDATARELAGRHEVWARNAAEAVRTGQAHTLATTAQTVDALLTEVDGILTTVGTAEVTVTGSDLAPLLGLAEHLRAHITANGPLKVKADGTPKTGMLTPRAVKEAQPLFEQVRVNGRVPTQVEHLTIFLAHSDGHRIARQLDAAWPTHVVAQGDWALRDRVGAHRAARELLGRVLDYGRQLADVSARMRADGFAPPQWSDPADVRTFLDAFDAVAAEESWTEATRELVALTNRLRTWTQDTRATHNLRDLAQAAAARDIAAYREAYERLVELHRLRALYARRASLDATASTVPELAAAVRANPDDISWAERLDSFDDAWQWRAVGTWLTDQRAGAVNEICRELDHIERQLREQAGILAVTRAWNSAVARLTSQARADLQSYSQQSKDIGKGTGKFAERKKADLRKTLADCRPAVPVWVMPIYRVVEQFEIKPEMFDVIVVDEASQAGVGAVFLQYLAPRVVVIGDDKQVSPSAVGMKQDDLNSLGKHLDGVGYVANWTAATRSLFDEAAMRFPSRITLVEHRRCVPEIIGFSNKLCYEPQGVPLVPVRRFGSDRLPPVRTVHVADGVESRPKVNEIEADRIVAQINECLADPAYDGKTFGVISLLGDEQAKAIWQKLVTVIPTEELEARQVHCGSAADFQGAERDVIFLSLVLGPRDSGRSPAQTKTEIEQRYNVAVSRAKDQVWLFHSVSTSDLTSSEDLRFKLLDYFTAVEANTGDADEPSERVSDDVLAAPFESLFEQRVYNALVDRGYRVQAHHTETSCDLDIVVTGRGGQLAVQCDADSWRDADAYRRELDAQRDLERCQWPIHRMREVEFVLDPAGCLGALEEALIAQGIYPIGGDPVEESALDAGSPDVVSLDAVAPDAVESDCAPGEFDGATADDVDLSVLAGFEWERPAVDDPVPVAAEPESDVADEGVLADDDARWVKPAKPSALDAYVAFTETLESPTTAAHATIVEDLCRIVEVEGPVSEARLRAVYVSAAGSRERDNVRRTITRALRAAVGSGRILLDDPLGLGDESVTYRLSAQPVTRVRTLKPRAIDQVPPRELAEVMVGVAARIGWDDEYSLFKAVLVAFGASNLTAKADTALKRVVGLAHMS